MLGQALNDTKLDNYWPFLEGRDGKITKEELAGLAKKYLPNEIASESPLDYNISERVNLIMNRYDTNKDGVIDFYELRKVMNDINN